MSLEDLCARLSDLYFSIQSYHPPASQFPIIDLTTDPDGGRRDSVKEVLPGLRFLRDEVKRDYDMLNKEPAGLGVAPSTNAPYLVAVWDELVHARHPVAIYRTFYSAQNGRHNLEKPRQNRSGPTKRPANGKNQVRAIKVDVVAENGARWVRVNTIKNARLMVEFREIDSYLTSDEDEEPRHLSQTEFDNSVLRMGRELLAAAKANPVANPSPFSSLTRESDWCTPSSDGMMTPQVTVCLTRLDPCLKGGDTDPRIGKTIQCLRDMGINVQLGERSCPYPPIPEAPMKPSLLEPTMDINLDLSALIALISDISHAPLPKTEQEAYTRFEPPQHFRDWKRGKIKSHARQDAYACLCDGADDGGEDGGRENLGQHSRALAAQAIQEMSKGVMEEIHERLSAVASRSSMLLADVTFWTTGEARHRCLQIVSKIGGERERKRADALLGSAVQVRMPEEVLETSDVEGASSPDAYWAECRYPARLLPLPPVRVYSSLLPTVENDVLQPKSPFFDALAQTCTQILSHATTPTSILVSRLSELPPTALDQTLDEIPPAPQTSLSKLTVHTVSSMLAGASRGYTTLTTNKNSVKTILKEMRRVCGRDVYDFEPAAAMTDDTEIRRLNAALWILGPRSLSEGMRSEQSDACLYQGI